MTKRYAEYRDSGVEWLGEVPTHWRLTRLRFAVTLNPSRTEVTDLREDAEVSFVPMEAVGERGELSLSQTRPVSEVSSGYTYMREGDVTFAKITPCFENGKGAIMRDLVGGIAFGTTELTVLRARPDTTDPAFLARLLGSPIFRRTGEAAMYGAGGQKRVPDIFVRNFSLALPPLPEQQAIAAFLDREVGKIDGLVEAQRRLIALLAEKRRAVISHAVTRGLNPAAPLKPSGVDWLGDIPAHWVRTKAGFYIKVISGFAFPSTGFLHGGDGERLLRGTNVGVGRIDWDDVVYWAREENDGLEGFELEDGDLVLGMDRPWISAGVRVARISAKDLPCLLLQRVACIRPKPALHSRYLESLLATDAFVHHFLPETTGVSVPHISPKQIVEFPIPLPPLDEQAAIVAYVDAQTGRLDALSAEAERAVSLLLERRAALISAAVTGKIDVRDEAEATEAA
ncbi:type I restriction enzyme, S subunit [Albimonas donghaensis]|uniref:Type I restriction enzyme, S subunit n=1 Tax=Albimonas donghaensis TaxID=356660 RepID=A0A1H3A1K0_9RHOB|nr:restriction endonuclease subunit S [Albimonas donghaensis]SDX22799.1 type I restriction enzyme, S subunit [Albimonas donghaensis]